MRRNNPNGKRRGTRAKNKKDKKTSPNIAHAHGKIKIMEIAIYVIAAISVILGIISRVLSSGGHRDESIWVNCLAVVCIVAGGFCWYQNLLWKKDAASVSFSTKKDDSTPTIEEEINYYSKNAAAKNWKPPIIPADRNRIEGNPMIQIKFGGMMETQLVGSEDSNMSRAVIPPGGAVVTPYLKDDRVYIKAKVISVDSERTIMLNSEGVGNIPEGWDKNFNEDCFEIVDRTSLPVLQIRYHSAHQIEVYGIFIGQDGAKTIAFGNKTMTVQEKQPTPQIPERKAWFKYPSKRFLGILAK